jgi:AAA domain, putative AbiEii toxin, Type IV TA system
LPSSVKWGGLDPKLETRENRHIAANASFKGVKLSGLDPLVETAKSRDSCVWLLGALQKTALAREISLVEQRADERKQCHDQRVELRAQLRDVRDEMTDRRKNQLTGINSNLSLTIRDYTIFVKYDDSGITAEFVTFMKEKMHGTYLQDNLIETLCSNIAPSALADLILDQDAANIAILGKISVEWANKIVDNLCYWRTLFELQVLAKQPKPVVTVLTKSAPPREIPVLHLSDGQRHTILLTIAMLADSNIPLVIDQPEDDLDNAFIFASIVTTLRQIKEKRQVILVTHNANIAVLGDSELILPMHRENDCGKAKDRGSIDAGATKACVIGILEGGKDAFMKRKEMYNH